MITDPQTIIYISILCGIVMGIFIGVLIVITSSKESAQIKDLTKKVQQLVDYLWMHDMLEKGDEVFTFPDGTKWQASVHEVQKL